ncbi:MAG: DUF6359 domain-containing protein [Bacteroidales bacterium]|nr:DUF6359 domain-containing protein [Bacteroidales bacterium]MDD4670280.1 DUF6359 domain-containing protein [Bacteroidales bacterium]
MKRIVLMGIISSIALASCQGLPDTQEKECYLSFNFAEPVKSIQTKSSEPLDTNSFNLLIRSNSGDTLYSGRYGNRPSEIAVPSGTYELSVESVQFDSPEFDKPQYGDRKVIVVSNGENVTVSFLCRQLNSALRLKFTEKFKNKYGNGVIVLKQEAGQLDYSYMEARTAYLKAANAEFGYREKDSVTSLFNRVLGAGELHTITLDASSNESQSYFTIQVDTSVIRIDEQIIVGNGYFGENGKSSDKALSIESAKSHVGDTIWVWGYIVGGDMSSSSVSFTAPFTKDSHIAIAAAPSETGRERCFSVELSKTAVKSALNLVSNPGNLGKKVFLKGEIVSSYFGLAGMKKVSDFKIE